jgi:hypothetical protein
LDPGSGSHLFEPRLARLRLRLGVFEPMDNFNYNSLSHNVIEKISKFLFIKSSKDRNEDNIIETKIIERKTICSDDNTFYSSKQTLMKALMHSNNIQRLREQLMKKKCQNGINFVNE